MDFINSIKERARQNMKTIVLPEASDARILKAAEIALNEGYANIVLLGNHETVANVARENGIERRKEST